MRHGSIGQSDGCAMTLRKTAWRREVLAPLLRQTPDGSTATVWATAWPVPLPTRARAAMCTPVGTAHAVPTPEWLRKSIVDIKAVVTGGTHRESFITVAVRLPAIVIAVSKSTMTVIGWPEWPALVIGVALRFAKRVGEAGACCKCGGNARHAAYDLANMVVFGLLRTFLGFALVRFCLLSLHATLLRLHRGAQACVAQRTFLVLVGFDIRPAIIAYYFHGRPRILVRS